MVMHRVRASSYLRLTVSEPYTRCRRPSTAGIPAVDLEAAGIPLAGVPHELLPRTWNDDWLGMKLLFSSKLNWGLALLPFGVLSGYTEWSVDCTFWLNFLALIPLASMLGCVTEELALHTGDLVGGLINATFGNAVEMILTLQALHAGLLGVVQGTLLGSILGNLLLVLGTSFFAGGLFHYMQRFNARGASCSTSLLLLACLAFIAPTVGSNGSNATPYDVLLISRVSALLVAGIYCLFLFFQLSTHLALFKQADFCSPDASPMCCCYGGLCDGGDEAQATAAEGDWPSVSAAAALLLLLLTTAAVTLASSFLVGSITSMTERSGIPQSFISVVLLPLVGNAAEHVTAVSVAVKNKPDLTMGVAVGSSTQIALFMMPFAVLAGWLMGQPLTLAFSHVGAVVLCLAVLIVIGVVQDGATNWFEGAMLITAYAIVAVVFWFHEPSDLLMVPAAAAAQQQQILLLAQETAAAAVKATAAVATATPPP